MEWICENKEWLFSGIGVAIISALIGVVFGKRNTRMKQKGGNHSINIQAGRDYNAK